MATTPQRSRFKRSFGQANHFLVTIIVGLHTVKSRGAVPPPDLPAAWDPKDPNRSAERSETFAIQGALVFLVTALDQYLGEVARLIRPTSPKLATALDAAAKNDKGLRGEIRAFAEFAAALDTAELALVEAALQWRNRFVHPNSNARFNNELRNHLVEHSQEFENDYRHLDPKRMIARFEAGEDSPTLKEIAGMITAAQRFIRRVDSRTLEKIDYDQYLEEILRRHLAEGSHEMAQDRANRIWGRTEQRAGRAIVTLARQNGFRDPTENASLGITESTIMRIAAFSCRDAMANFGPVLPSDD